MLTQQTWATLVGLHILNHHPLGRAHHVSQDLESFSSIVTLLEDGWCCRAGLCEIKHNSLVISVISLFFTMGGNEFEWEASILCACFFLIGFEVMIVACLSALGWAKSACYPEIGITIAPLCWDEFSDVRSKSANYLDGFVWPLKGNPACSWSDSGSGDSTQRPQTSSLNRVPAV